jgi:hypothetical protein
MPGQPLRGGLGLSGRLDFWPLEGGSEELSGVLGGMFSLASSAATRAVSAAFYSMRASISAISSDLSSLPSDSGVIPSLNQPTRTRSSRHARVSPSHRTPIGGEQLQDRSHL